MPLTHEPDPQFLIAESPNFAVCLNKNQDLIGRCYLLLKRPEIDPTALTDSELSELWTVVRSAKKAIDAAFNPDHYNFAFLMNVDPQVHFHIIPRYKEKREFSGGTYVDPNFGGHYSVGPEKFLDDEAYAAIITTLRRHFG
jgi:diadenosine tetraphosphate (Ap4A) HIT family hydrolase